MARPRLTKEAIAFIIECRDSPSEIYTWDDIAKLVGEKFDIHVSFQAIAKNYERYKGNIELLSLNPNSMNKLNRTLNSDRNNSPTPPSQSNNTSDVVIKINSTKKENQRKEFIETSEEDLKKFLQGE